jgi:hypothetical protein
VPLPAKAKAETEDSPRPLGPLGERVSRFGGTGEGVRGWNEFEL